MVRFALLISHLLFVILTSMLCSTSVASSRVITSMASRPCTAYTRCRTGPFVDSSVLNANSAMRYGENLISDSGTFAVGFFTRGEKGYLGIWYNLPSTPQVIVWVANRDNPVPSRLLHNSSLVIAGDGNAKFLDSNNHTYWSTASIPFNGALTYLKITDEGNLLLQSRGSGRGMMFWQSFDNPTDTFLPGMDISQGDINLTSWKSLQDPATGHYSFQKGESGETSNELFVYNNSSASPYWSSIFSPLHPYLIPLFSRNITENLTKLILRVVMSTTGSVQLWELPPDQEDWSILWSAPQDQCDLYESCGSYGVCDAGNSFKCRCLPGYQPSNPLTWESQDFSAGCSAKSNYQYGEVFLPLPMIRLPPQPYNDFSFTNGDDCGSQCLSDYGCRAYSFDTNQSRCLILNYPFSHVEEEYYNVDAHTLYIRLNQLDIGGSRTCEVCGTNVIPYPLSTELGCGDPAYLSFECNATNSQVYFNPPSGGAYKVSHIDPVEEKFTIQLVPASVLKCDSANDIALKVFNLNESSPFNVTKCSIAHLMNRTVVEVQVSWRPLLPPCNSSVDCSDWPETTCDWDEDGKKVCMCANGLHWNSFVNCAKDDHHKHIPLFLKVGMASATVLFLLIGIFVVIHLRRRRVTYRKGIVDQFTTDELEDFDIPFVDYQSILAATNNFSDANKLGAGGFGPVYKGSLADGNEVAVKRLSAASLQGVQELRNEIIVIGKLQHRNLVRVVGYCIKEDEKILIYEYMPNKSLDSLLFDQAVSPLLDWAKRFNIILGIARGLLYLHQDSRLRIIHRDLKPSNILLDEELNPKISDFGLAKIVAGNEMAANTARVVGTYGYMSPEYALDGQFSVKSDVYSFGTIVFEVITGRRCSSLLQLGDNLVSVLGYAWALWEKGEELEMMDKAIIDTCDSNEVKRCINVAFLCIQEDPRDRPTMSSALLMLGGDKVNLPCPKQPVFVARRQPLGTASSSTHSNVNLTTTTVEGR